MSQRQMTCGTFKERVQRKTTMEFAKTLVWPHVTMTKDLGKEKTWQQQQGLYLIKLTLFYKVKLAIV